MCAERCAHTGVAGSLGRHGNSPPRVRPGAPFSRVFSPTLPCSLPLLHVSVSKPRLLSSPSRSVSPRLLSPCLALSLALSLLKRICPGCPAAWILLRPWLSFLLPQSSQLLTHLWHPLPHLPDAELWGKESVAATRSRTITNPGPFWSCLPESCGLYPTSVSYSGNDSLPRSLHRAPAQGGWGGGGG